MNVLDIREASESKLVDLESLSRLSGFPTKFIKEELLISSESISMNELRSTMMKFLAKTMNELDERA